MAEVTATLYRIVKCRYFDEDLNKSFGKFSLVAADLGRWISKQASVGETCTFEPSEDGTILRTFCLDFRKLTAHNALLIVTWNEVSGTEEGVQVVASNSAVGSAKVSTTEIDALSVPGYPAFFVLLPDRELILNIRFNAHRLNGSTSFQKYVHGFMEEGAKWAVWKGDKFKGYALDGKTVKGSYLPEFQTGLVRRSADLDWLRQNVGDIRKIVHRKLIKPVIEEHRDFLDRAFILLGLKPNRRLKADIDFEYDFKIHLTAGKLEEIIAEYETKGEDDGWTDVGFIMARNSQKRHWLSGAICREKFDFDVSYSAADMADIESLVEVLNDRLAEILQRVQ